MRPERRLQILERLAGYGDRMLDPTNLCAVGADVTATSGAGIMLFDRGISKGSLCATDAKSELVEELQFTMGEGPCIDSWRERQPILEPDLLSPATIRWLAFGPAAVAAGVRAVFGFPVRIGAAELGSLYLYRDLPGPLTEDQHADALVVADMAADLIVLLQTDVTPGELAGELRESVNLHAVVHQASGMVSAQLGVTVDHALVRLRAHAFRTGRPLVDVARDVVQRALRFDPHDHLGGGA